MRTVTLVLVDHIGLPLGALAPFPVESPYWPEVGMVVTGARERFGIDVTILRVLTTPVGERFGGDVTYLAEANRGQIDELPAGALAKIDHDLPEHPRRAPYARPGGPTTSLRWAEQRLAELGHAPIIRTEQRKTWNLSSIWRLETNTGTLWLKEAPHFYAHESRVLDWVAAHGLGDRVVTLIAHEGGRMLLDHVDGRDLFGADLATRHAIAADMHEIHLRASTDIDSLRMAGVPDRRAPQLIPAVRAVIDAHPTASATALAVFAAELDDRMAALASCGLPDTLIHGDLHPGNVRGDLNYRRLIDWGDSAIAHPGFDILRLAGGLDEADAAALLDAWAIRWRLAVPGSEPERAVALLRGIDALNAASVYATFVANIEPDEHPYHALDVGECLERAAATLSR